MYEIREIAIIVIPEGCSIFDENTTRIEIVDEAAGEFLEVSQIDNGKIRITPEEWTLLKIAIDRMINQCKMTM